MSRRSAPTFKIKSMKTVTRYLAAGMLLGMAVEINTSLTTPVPPGASGPTQTGFVLKPIPFSAVHHQQAGIPRLRLWDSTSGNWSGYAVPLEKSGVTDTFSDVQGTWVVPAVTGAKRTTTYSSVWVGLDGYDDGTVEQIGTEQDWTGTRQQNYVWFEMYPSGAYEIENFPANPGDSISAQVLYTGTTTVQQRRGNSVVESVFQLTIVNNTHKVSFTVPSSYTTTASAARASAEWVVEAPSSSRGILPLADFGTVSFSDCAAIGLKGTGSITSLWPFDPLTMIDPNGGASAPIFLSSDGTAFSVSWAAK